MLKAFHEHWSRHPDQEQERITLFYRWLQSLRL